MKRHEMTALLPKSSLTKKFVYRFSRVLRRQAYKTVLYAEECTVLKGTIHCTVLDKYHRYTNLLKVNKLVTRYAA